MRELADKERIKAFIAARAREATTIDIDLVMRPESDARPIPVDRSALFPTRGVRVLSAVSRDRTRVAIQA